MQELSQWFNLSEQKPWENCVYIVRNEIRITECAAYWDGDKFWFAENCERNFNRAVEIANKKKEPGGWEARISEWRGLSSDPSKPAPSPKPRGNRRVTRYVVMQHVEDIPIAVFESKELAIDFAERSKHFCYIEKIRFRTPEASQA